MVRDRLPLNKEMVPYSYDITLGDAEYTLEFNYNSQRDLFSVNLLKDDVLVCAGERLVYGRPLFANSYRLEEYPPLDFVPYDESGTESDVNWRTLGDTVFLTVDDGSGQSGGEEGGNGET